MSVDGDPRCTYCGRYNCRSLTEGRNICSAPITPFLTEVPMSVALELSEIRERLANIEKHLHQKDIFIQVYALNRILLHLEEAQKDPRKKERARATVALVKINEWLAEGKAEYERIRKA